MQVQGLKDGLNPELIVIDARVARPLSAGIRPSNHIAHGGGTAGVTFIVSTKGGTNVRDAGYTSEAELAHWAEPALSGIVAAPI